jgi:hypothetical protein
VTRGCLAALAPREGGRSLVGGGGGAYEEGGWGRRWGGGVGAQAGGEVLGVTETIYFKL